MIKKILLIIFIFMMVVMNSTFSYAQDKKERIGLDELTKTGANYYNYADKDKVNIEVSVWGFVKNTGKYLVPSGTTFIDLITLCGGPQADAKLNDMRIIRLKNDSLNIKESKLFVLNYKDYLNEDKIAKIDKQNPVLLPGDIVLVPGLKEYTFRDNIGLVLSILTSLISIAVLLLTIFRN